MSRKHTEAQVELAFKGCSNPESWADIEDAAKKANRDLRNFIKQLHQEN